MDPEKALPSDIETEKAILGAICLNNELLAQALLFLESADFFLGSHRCIFDAMVNLGASGNPIDALTLPALLNQWKELEQVGGVTYLASLIDGVPRTDNIEYYCRIIKYKAKERNAIKTLNYELSQLMDGEEELETILGRVQSGLAKIKESGDDRAFPGVYATLDAFFEAHLEEPEQILFGVHRGEVAGLLAVTNYGKTTALYNTALSMAAGERLWPLAPIVLKPRRILYLDSESPALRSRADLQTMIRSISNNKAARENFAIVADAMINGSPLNLSKPDHFKRIVALAKTHRADLVVIDTAASAFELQDENSNAEVTRRVMNPLKQLAREANCAVIFTHHIGKSNETQTGEGAYRGRGASAFGALSRTIFTLERDAKKGPEYIVLNCAKVKGQPFEPVLLKLNPETRWFELCEEKPEAKPEPPTAKEVADLVRERQEICTADICEHFKLRAGKRTIEDRIRKAEQLGLIMKPHQKAPWRFRNGKNGHFTDVGQVVEESTDEVFPQSANTIEYCGNAETLLNHGSQASLAHCSSCGAAGLSYTHCERCGEFLMG